jgi:hypothetical protein
VFAGGHRNPSLIQIAQGFLQDGRRFQFQINVHEGIVKSSRLSLR